MFAEENNREAWRFMEIEEGQSSEGLREVFPNLNQGAFLREVQNQEARAFDQVESNDSCEDWSGSKAGRAPSGLRTMDGSEDQRAKEWELLRFQTGFCRS
ncbi:hypothetical protein F0562_007633 [Nyssa sinensis]|uniref:Uncharacterized protein n=1 Tax=Nyssa sinensis TaxID=561372 RepID=A0A5J5A6Y1_9ASTE|nr:hypothetical protein F0562_007633 [Nyssa sinensis]